MYPDINQVGGNLTPSSADAGRYGSHGMSVDYRTDPNTVRTPAAEVPEPENTRNKEENARENITRNNAWDQYRNPLNREVTIQDLDKRYRERGERAKVEVSGDSLARAKAGKPAKKLPTSVEPWK
jgi:hypothetical protein